MDEKVHLWVVCAFQSTPERRRDAFAAHSVNPPGKNRETNPEKIRWAIRVDLVVVNLEVDHRGSKLRGSAVAQGGKHVKMDSNFGYVVQQLKIRGTCDFIH